MKNKYNLKCECGSDFYKPHKCPRAGNRIVGDEVNCSLADSFMAIFGYKRVKSKKKK